MAPNSEIPWVDAWIRWERNSKQSNNEDDITPESDNDSLPPPTECQTFSYKDISIQIDGYHVDSQQIWNSTGLTLWRSSHYLCQFLVDRNDLFLCSDANERCNTVGVTTTNKGQMNILEVGSGLGKCGILAHLLSKSNNIPTNTLLTDGDTDTLKQLRRNVQTNIPNDASIECHQLLWGQEHAIQFLKRHTNERFDLIIGSDLLYVTSVIRPLFETVGELLQPNGVFVMAHCCRRVGNEVTLEEVLDVACELGLDWVEELRNEEDIVLYSFRLK